MPYGGNFGRKSIGRKMPFYWEKSKAICLLFWSKIFWAKNAVFLEKKYGYRLAILFEKPLGQEMPVFWQKSMPIGLSFYRKSLGQEMPVFWQISKAIGLSFFFEHLWDKKCLFFGKKVRL